MKRIIAVLAVLSLLCFEGRAQFASLGSEKSSTRWETLTSGNYRVIYPVGLDSLGLVYSAYLEQYRPLVGNSLGLLPNQQYKKPMPVILHPFAATTNGAVVWAPRRMALYTFPNAYGILPPVPWEKILSIHENRHVAQLQFTRRAFWEFLYWPYGEVGLALVGSLYANSALLEGDAVVAETALTNSGRGRTADFLSYIRMSFANGDMRDWFRWRYGSQRWYTPDYYRIGYMTVAGMRYNYDATMFMGDYLWKLSTSPVSFNAMQKTMKKYSGKGIKGTWEEIATSFKEMWAQDDSLRAPFQETLPLVAPSSFYTSYSGAVQTKDGRVFALRAGLDKSQELIELLSDGTVKAVRPMDADSRLTYSKATDCIYWAETRPDLRWDMAQTSRIRFIKVGSGKVHDLTAPGRFVSPSVSEDGEMLAAVEYPLEGGSRIVLIDITDGGVLKSIKAPDGLQVTEVAFMGNRVAFTGISDDGTGIYVTDYSWTDTLEEAVPVKIKNLISRAGTLYFTCDRTGTNEIYSYVPGTLTQLTNTQHGASSPFFKDNELCFSALTPSGSLLSTVSETLSRAVSFKDYASYPIADILSAQEKEFAEIPADTAEPVKSRYSRGKEFFHIHSWMPAYLNWGGFSASQKEYDYDLVSFGGTAFFQNLTGTASGMLGFSFHVDPFDQEKPAAGLHARLKYTGLYPVFDVALDVGDRRSAKISRAWIPAKDSTFIALIPKESPFVGGSVGVSVPLNLSSGGRETTIEPNLTFKFSNDALGESLAFYTEDGLAEIGSSTPSGKKGRQFFPNMSLVAGVKADTRRAVAPSQVIPRLGVGGELRYIQSPRKDGIGSGMYLKAYAYLPGFTSIQGIKLSAAAQTRTQEWHLTYPAGSMLSYMLPMDVWALGFEDMAPRGFAKTGVGASMLLTSPASAIFSVDYVMPMFFIDRAFSPFIYLSNMEINPFADFSLFVPDQVEHLYSVGADIVFRFEKLLAVSSTVKLGVRIAYNGGTEQLYNSAGLKSPFYIGLVANSEL